MSSHAVTVQLCETFAAVLGLPEPLPLDLFGRPRHTTCKQNSQRQLRLGRRYAWFPTGHSGVQFCPLRCVDVLCGELRRRGHQVRVQENTPLSAPPPGMLDRLGFAGPERSLAEQLYSRTSTNIECDRVQQVARLITIATRVLPKARMLITVKNLAMIDQVLAALEPTIRSGIVSSAQNRTRDRWPQRIIAPINKLELCHPDTWDWLFIDADLMLFRRRYQYLCGTLWKRIRITGYTLPGRRLTAYELMLQEFLLGAPLSFSGRSERRDPVQIHWWSRSDLFRDSATRPNSESDAAIAKLARAFVSGDAAHLQQVGWAPLTDSLYTQGQPSRRVVLVVRNAQELERLKPLLPGWVPGSCTPNESGEWSAPVHHGWPKSLDPSRAGRVMTLMYAQQLACVEADLVIIAAPSIPWSLVGGWANSSRSGPPRQLLLFPDNSSPEAQYYWRSAMAKFRERPFVHHHVPDWLAEDANPKG